MEHVRRVSSLTLDRRSFTLIELLIVIAVVAILSVVVILTLNPGELLKQARDSNRISDMDTLNRAMLLYIGDRGGSLGTASTTYFSLVDSTATSTAGTNCAGVGLTAPTNWNYRCAASSTVRKIDGTGWIPLNFSSMTFNPPMGSLPVDPTNTSSSGLFYAYIPGTTTYAISAQLDSTKFLSSKGYGDGGTNPARFETGSNLSLSGQGDGLIGWWTFDEGNGTVAADSSSRGNTGTITSGTWVAGKNGQALSMNSTGLVDLASTVTISNSNWTVLAWLKTTSTGTQYILTHQSGGPVYNALRLNGGRANYYHYNGAWLSEDGTATIHNGNWRHLVWAHETGYTIDFYVDGAVDRSNMDSTLSSVGTVNRIGNIWNTPNTGLIGQIDDLRIYSRALSPAEITAIYNAQR